VICLFLVVKLPYSGEINYNFTPFGFCLTGRFFHRSLHGLTMSTHITKVVAGCFASLRQLRSVRRSLSHESFTRLVVALVLAQLDYCNGVLAGLPASQLSRLQSVLHAAARLIYGVRRYDHVTPLLQQLHWLSVPEQVTFKLCVMVYRCLHAWYRR